MFKASYTNHYRTGLIKTLLYTGVRVAELVATRIADVDLDACRIRITRGKGGKDRSVSFPAAFKETLALHIAAARSKGATFLFESSWKKPYSIRGVRAMLARYAAKAPAWTTTCHPTGCGASCSPGSRLKASTMPSSSSALPAVANPPASPGTRRGRGPPLAGRL
nr:tyrosine-type recombinase/integrase [Sphaerisporangium perillae]